MLAFYARLTKYPPDELVSAPCPARARGRPAETCENHSVGTHETCRPCNVWEPPDHQTANNNNLTQRLFLIRNFLESKVPKGNSAVVEASSVVAAGLVGSLWSTPCQVIKCTFQVGFISCGNAINHALDVFFSHKMSVYLSIYLSVSLSVCLSIAFLFVC